MGGLLGERIAKCYTRAMTNPKHKSVGNRIAPARFLLFLALLSAAATAIQSVTGNAHYAVMGGFDLAAALFLVSLWPDFRDGDAGTIPTHATKNDANRPMLLVIATIITAVLLITIAGELAGPGEALAWLIIITLAIAWIFANTVFALHYAHLFYGEGAGENSLTFPGTKAPDYWDFAYFAFTLGMTFQTSDVTVNDQSMRRIVLAQCMVAFVFNIGILAFTINTLGGG